jgi:hypothetical protein
MQRKVGSSASGHGLAGLLGTSWLIARLCLFRARGIEFAVEAI